MPRALHSNGAAVQFDQMSNDRQAKTKAAMPTPDGAVRLPEAFEHVRQELLIDSR